MQLQKGSHALRASRSLILLEHGGLGVLAEEACKVEISGHELLLHVLQRPLVFHDLQRLPLALAQTKQRACERRNLLQGPDLDPAALRLTLKALLGSGGIAMAAPVICSCMMRDWSAAARKQLIRVKESLKKCSESDTSLGRGV